MTTLLLLSVLCLRAEARSFPATPDATEAAQQQWGSVQTGYIAEGCWHPTAAGLTVTLQPCRAFALDDDGGAPALKGFHEPTSRAVTFSGGDGLYWIAGRSWPGEAPAGWTCLPGVHYCWVKSDTLPPLPSGLVLLSRSTALSGAVTEVVIMAPWKRTTPYRVPAGQTLVFGVCPDMGPVPLWEALGDSSSGTVGFAPGACAIAPVEWWGADPSGLVDATAAWRAAIAAVTVVVNETTGPHRGLVPLACRGIYRISSSGTTSIALNLARGTQILGSYYAPGGGNPQNPCRFEYHGDGIALGNVFAIDTTRNRIQLRNLQVYDVDGTGAFGLSLNGFSGNALDNVLVRGFGVGAYFGTLVYYTEIRRLLLYGSRSICLDLAGVVNGAQIDAQCNAAASTEMLAGVRVGQTPGLYGTSADLRLNVLVETGSGTPVSIDRARALDLNAYIEMPGNGDNYTFGAVLLRRVDGGRVHVRAIGNVSGGTAPPYGLRFVAAPDDTGALHNRNILVTGSLQRFTTPVYVEGEPGGWGINTTGLSLAATADTGQEIYPVFSTGVMLARNYLTHGDAPLVDEGRGSTLGGSSWVQGDLIFATPQGDGRIGNRLRQVTVPGNPPTVMELMIPTLSAVRLLDGQAVVQLLTGNTYATRLIVEASSTAMTDLEPYLPGHCVNVLALGARTLVHSALLRLAGSVDYAMSGGNTLYLCRDDPNGPWREYGRCSTCTY